MKLLWILLAALLFVVVALALAIAIVPHFLDRIYYKGPKSGHFDGQRFFNPDVQDEMQGLPGSRGRLMWNQLTGRDGRPAWPDHVAVMPGRPPARVEGDRLVVTWIGHATVLIQTQGLNIVTDPIWSDRTGPQLGPARLGPRRVAAPGVAFDDLPKIDAVLLSHDHYDHMDRVTLQRLWRRDRPRVVTSLGNDAVVAAWGLGAAAVDWNEAVPLAPGVRVAVVRAHHWGTRYGSDRNRALWSGFVLVLPSGGNVWFAGDTGMGDGRWPAEAAAFGPIRLALLPIGAFRFHEGQMAIGSHMGPVDAVEVYRRSGAARAIPIHWGTFRLSYEARDTPPRLLEAAMRCTGQAGFEAVAIGAPTEVAPYAAPAAGMAMSREALLRCLDTPEVRAMR